MPNLSALYRFRFKKSEQPHRMKIWKTLCDHFFQELIGNNLVVADLACGYGEFINNIHARRKIAIDLNPDARDHLSSDVEFVLAPATDVSAITGDSVDVVFTSNFLEHLKTKEECDAVFAEVRRMLKAGGRFIIMGPNIRYLASQYWDFYDHYLPLSHLSLQEGLVQAGYDVEMIIPRFLPYTTQSALPQAPVLISLYLKLPLAWRLIGKQFLVVGRKPDEPAGIQTEPREIRSRAAAP
jgi:SAM-dependent methyltransferase